MAKHDQTTATVAPKAPAAPAVPGTPAAPTAPAAPAAPAASKKKTRVVYEELFPTAEAAETEAANRTKGPRKAWKVTDHAGKEFFVVHNNEGRAAGVVALKHLGVKVEKLGGGRRVTRPQDAPGVMELINSLPEAEREKIKAMMAGKVA